MVHLHTHSWFSFLGGASSPAALVETAADWGYGALALTDTNTLAGAVQFARACREVGIKPIYGATVDVDGFRLVFICADNTGYANLCDLLTLAHLNHTHPPLKTHPTLKLKQLAGHTEGLLCLTGDRWGRLATLLRAEQYAAAKKFMEWLERLFPQRLFLELTHHQRPGDDAMMQTLARLGEACQLPLVATNAVRYAHPKEFALYDSLFCARQGMTIFDPHQERPVNNREYLRPPDYMAQLGFPPAALANTDAVAAMCDVDLLQNEVIPPAAQVPPGVTPTQYLWQLCRLGLQAKYPQQNRQSPALATLRKEMAVITELGLEEFFLVVREVIEFARSCNIRCSGRGSAANSVAAYLLGITNVDPIQHRLLFERFLHTGRKGMPDIDVDFASDRRNEVIAWMNHRFGESHTAMTANVVTFRLRLAVREMAKVLGYPLPLIDQLAKVLPYGSARHVREHRTEIAAIMGESPLLEALLYLTERLHGCPRHLSLHSGGMILSRVPLRHLSPVQTSANGVRQIQFNKDDVEALGLIKFDVLGLRMLSVVSETLELLRTDTGAAPDVDRLPLNDRKAFELIRSGQTMSVFQIESPGQWNLLSRTQPQTFDDLVAQVALFRPGPLQGNMVHPFTLRRRGLQPVTYLHPSLEPVLKDTYGIVLYQEQVLEIAHVFAGLSLAEADEFRRLMSKFRDSDEMENMRARFVEGAIAQHGVKPQVANQVFDIIAKFVGYGFCRSHAAAFAHTVYQTAYLKAHHTAAYLASVLQHHPGFYPLSTIIEEAKQWGITILPVDVCWSDVKYKLERGAIRVPLTQIKGMSADGAAAIVLERAARPFASLEDLYRRVALAKDVWDGLARSGALRVFGERRQVLWQVGALARQLGPSGSDQLAFDASALPTDEMPPLAKLKIAEITAWNYQTQGITTGPHPLSLHRPYLTSLGATPIRELLAMPIGSRVLTAGAAISKQRPPTAKGMCFVILEDETGRLPTAITPPMVEKYHRALRASNFLIEGRLEGSGPGQIGSYRSVLIQRLWPLHNIVESRP